MNQKNWIRLGQSPWLSALVIFALLWIYFWAIPQLILYFSKLFSIEAVRTVPDLFQPLITFLPWMVLSYLILLWLQRTIQINMQTQQLKLFFFPVPFEKVRQVYLRRSIFGRKVLVFRAGILNYQLVLDPLLAPRLGEAELATLAAVVSKLNFENDPKLRSYFHNFPSEAQIRTGNYENRNWLRVEQSDSKNLGYFQNFVALEKLSFDREQLLLFLQQEILDYRDWVEKSGDSWLVRLKKQLFPKKGQESVFAIVSSSSAQAITQNKKKVGATVFSAFSKQNSSDLLALKTWFQNSKFELKSLGRVLNILFNLAILLGLIVTPVILALNYDRFAYLNRFTSQQYILGAILIWALAWLLIYPQIIRLGALLFGNSAAQYQAYFANIYRRIFADSEVQQRIVANFTAKEEADPDREAKLQAKKEAERKAIESARGDKFSSDYGSLSFFLNFRRKKAKSNSEAGVADGTTQKKAKTLSRSKLVPKPVKVQESQEQNVVEPNRVVLQKTSELSTPIQWNILPNPQKAKAEPLLAKSYLESFGRANHRIDRLHRSISGYLAVLLAILLIILFLMVCLWFAELRTMPDRSPLIASTIILFFQVMIPLHLFWHFFDNWLKARSLLIRLENRTLSSARIQK